MSVRVELPELHPAQAVVAASKAPRKVLRTGRRFGKTTYAAAESVEYMLDGKRVLLCSATQDQADAFWRLVVEWCGDAISAKLVKKNETKRTLECNGGRIKVKTASNPDALRGDWADLIVLDEAALLDPDMTSAVMPMLIDRRGELWLLSSPRPRGIFRDLCLKAEADTTGRWETFKFSTYDNPHLSREAIDDLASDLTERERKQELEAEFVASEETVFRNFDAILTLEAGEPERHAAHLVVGGVDWAQVEDRTCVSIFCADCLEELDLDYFNRLPWQQQRDRITALSARWGVALLYCESNSIGSPNIEALEEAGLPVKAWTTTSQSKAQMVQALALSFEKAETRWLADRLARAELEAFEVTLSPQTNMPRYGHPPGGHDDTVIARCLSYQAAILAARYRA